MIYSPLSAVSCRSLLRVGTRGSLLRVDARVGSSALCLEVLDGVLDVDNAALRAGNRTANDDHVEFVVNLDDVEVLNRDLLNAHLACAMMALENTAGGRGGAHRTGLTVNRAAAVGHRGAMAAAALDRAFVAVALADAGDVDLVADCENACLDLVADVHLSSLFNLEFLQVLLKGNVCPLQVTCFRLGQLGFLDILKAQLNRIEAQLELQDEQNRSIMKNQRLRMLLTIIITVVLLVVLGLFWNHMDQAYKEVMTACTQVNELADTLQSSLDTLDPDELNNMMQDLPAITEQLKQLDVDSLNTVLQGLPTLMDNVNKLQQQVETITNTFSGISALFGK